MTLLGVNIDHVATLRNARGGREPEPVQAALQAEFGGADSIVCHLREDRRHITDRDVELLRQLVQTSLQLEMSLDEGVVNIALKVKPPEVMIVPERRAELTTEAGFDAVANAGRLKGVVEKLHAAGIHVSVFIDPDMKQVDAAHKSGASMVELHTGPYAHASKASDVDAALDALETAAHRAWELGMQVHAGHGLNYHNVERLIRQIPVEKVNIGHSIISRSVFSGIENAVRDMKNLVSSLG